jgi:serine protease AprX
VRPIPRRAVVSALLATLVPVLPNQAQTLAPASHSKLHPDLGRVVAELGGQAKGWVFFTDKGLSDAVSRTAALAEARAQLSERAIERRRARRTLPGLVDEHDVALAPAYLAAVRATGAAIQVESRWLNAVSVRGTLEQFEALAALDCVERVTPVRRGTLGDGLVALPAEEPGGPQLRGGFYGNSEAQLDQVGLLELHTRGFTGSSVVVGILDTGFHRGHEAFNQPGHVVNVIAEHDFVDGDGNTDIEVGDPASQHSHGTYILGVIGAYLPNQLVGGAYDASFILCKTEDTTNEYQQEEDFYAAGIQFIENNGGDLATSSLGYIDWYTQSDLDGQTAVTTLAVNVATANGMPCLTAAGNSGHDANPSTSALIAPADALQVISCAAVDSAGVEASFTSDGPTADSRQKPELAATGVATWTVCSNTDVGCLTQVNGTSLSTPVLAGMVACIIDAHPEFTVDQLRARLFRTGDYFLANGFPDPLYVVGWGIPDADRAAFDCNGNGIDDATDIANGTERDCNGNGLPDSCDVADGISPDIDGNGRPDECRRRTAPPPTGTADKTVPLVILPPSIRPGGLLRLAGPAGSAIEVVQVRSAGRPVGLVRGRTERLLDGRTITAIALPDVADLSGREVQVRALVREPGDPRPHWTESRVVTIR